MTILAEIYGHPNFFGSGPGFVNRTQSDPGFVNPVRSGPGFVIPIRSDPVLRGPFLERPGKLTGPVSYFEIEVSRKVGCVLTSNVVHFFSLAAVIT